MARERARGTARAKPKRAVPSARAATASATARPSTTATPTPNATATAGATSTAPRGRDPLLAAICHDLRAPLAALTMGANFVLQTTPDDPKNARATKILHAMLRSCAQMERLIRNFGDLSAIEGGAVELRLGMHDAGELLELAAEEARDLASARRVTFELAKPAEKIVVEADRDRLLRALGQLVENAVTHGPADARVTLRAERRPDGGAAFAVTNEGPELAADVREHLFDREWHAKRANRVTAGFGVAIARGFARAHGGDLTLASVPGATTFTVSLPPSGGSSGRRPHLT